MKNYNQFLRNITMMIEKGLFVSKDMKTEIEKAINGMDISESQYMAWWILAKSSGKLGDVGREKDYYANAVKIIQRLGDMIGDEMYRKSFLNKFPVRYILEGIA